MRAVIQRVTNANVTVEDSITGKINKGLLIFLGVENNDTENDLNYIIEKIINLRIFEDDNNKMNLSLLDVKGELLIVSQFTLLGDCRKGRRPSFTEAAPPDMAKEMYNKFIKICKEKEIKTQTGVFQADMKVNLCNDGPVTLLIDSKKNF